MRQAGIVVPMVLLAAMAAGGCASGGKGEQAREVTSFHAASEGVSALAGEWTVFELDQRPIVEQLHDSAARRPSLTIKPDGSVGGFSGVNQFGSELLGQELTRSRFALGPIAMTRMAGPPELMSIEAKLTLALSEPRRFMLKDNLLTLMPAEGRADPLVRFRRGAATGSK
jgi:heat shock protein HslJ